MLFDFIFILGLLFIYFVGVMLLMMIGGILFQIIFGTRRYNRLISKIERLFM